jgi:serine/threonine protein kinase
MNALFVHNAVYSDQFIVPSKCNTCFKSLLVHLSCEIPQPTSNFPDSPLAMAINQLPPGAQYELAQCVEIKTSTTRYLIRNSYDEIWWGQVPLPLYRVKSADPASLPVRSRLEPSDFFPPKPPYAHEFEGSLDDPNVFIKQSNFLPDTNFFNDPTVYRRNTEAEIQVCETLIEDLEEDPNVCKYLGLVLDSADRVIAIAYKKYDTDLWNAARTKMFPDLFTPATRKYIMDEVEKGMKYLHSWKFVHCDIRPENVLLKKGENGGPMEVVLCDFDSVKEVGKVLKGKSAPLDWWPKEYKLGKDVAECEIDRKQLAKFPKWFETMAVVFRNLYAERAHRS